MLLGISVLEYLRYILIFAETFYREDCYILVTQYSVYGRERTKPITEDERDVSSEYRMTSNIGPSLSPSLD